MCKQKILLWILVVVLLSSFAFGALDDDLVIYWHFDNHTLDSSGSNYHGTRSGATNSSNAKVNASLDFSAPNSKVTQTSSNLDSILSGTELSACAWNYLTSSSDVDRGTKLTWNLTNVGAGAEVTLKYTIKGSGDYEEEDPDVSF